MLFFKLICKDFNFTTSKFSRNLFQSFNKANNLNLMVAIFYLQLDKTSCSFVKLLIFYAISSKMLFKVNVWFLQIVKS